MVYWPGCFFHPDQLTSAPKPSKTIKQTDLTSSLRLRWQLRLLFFFFQQAIVIDFPMKVHTSIFSSSTLHNHFSNVPFPFLQSHDMQTFTVQVLALSPYLTIGLRCGWQIWHGFFCPWPLGWLNQLPHLGLIDGGWECQHGAEASPEHTHTHFPWQTMYVTAHDPPALQSACMCQIAVEGK